MEGFQGQLATQVLVTVSPQVVVHRVVQILFVRSANMYGLVGQFVGFTQVFVVGSPTVFEKQFVPVTHFIV